MKDIILNSIGNIQHDLLTSAFAEQKIRVVKRDKKQRDTKELIFYCSPESYLAMIKEQTTDSISIQLKSWKSQLEQQIDYVISNPKQSLLIDLDYAITAPEAFVEFIKNSLGIELNGVQWEQADTALQAQQALLLIEDESLQDLYEDAMAAADHFNQEAGFTVSDRLVAYFAEMQKITDARLVEANKKVELDSDKLTESEQLQAENAQQKIQIEALNTERESLKGENDLALLQIAQLQEELEATFVAKSELDKKLSSSQSECEVLKAGSAEQKAQLEKLNKERDDLSGENELALLQIAQLQEELEFYFIKSQTINVAEFKTQVEPRRLSHLKSSFQLASLLKRDAV